MTPVLQLEGVIKKYRRGDEQVHVLIDFDFTLDAGEFVVVTGPSGPASRPSCVSPAGWTRRVPAAKPRFRVQFFNLVPMLTAAQSVSLPLVLDGMPANRRTHAPKNYCNRSASSTEVLDVLRSLSDEDSTAVVMVTHDQPRHATVPANCTLSTAVRP